MNRFEFKLQKKSPFKVIKFEGLGGRGKSLFLQINHIL